MPGLRKIQLLNQTGLSEIQYSLSALLQWFRQTQHGTITVLAATNSDIFSQTDRPRNM